MTLKKIALMGLLALAAIALAAPSMASAEWTHNHEAIEENQVIPFEGTAGFTLGSSGTTCEISGAIEAEAGTTTGKLLHFNIGDHEECQSNGNLENCFIESATVTNETEPGKTVTESPPPIHITNGHIEVTHITIDTKYTNTALCPVTHNELHIAKATLTPDDPETISHLTVNGGTATVTLAPKSLGGPTIHAGTATLHGTVAVTPAKTWGFVSPTL